MLGVNYGPDDDPLAILAAAHARRDLGLCAGRRLSRRDQEAAEGAGALAGRRGRRRGEGVRRYRAGDGKAAGAGGGPRLAGQAHQSRVARIRLLAVPRRDLHRRSSCRATRPRPTIAAPARPASTSARPRRFPRPTSSMRGAASPISPSRTRGRSRTNSAKPSATASMAATIASRSARGTSSRKPAAKRSLPRATNCARRALADLARLDDAAFRALFAKSPVKRIGRDRFVRNVLIAIGNSGDARAGRPRPSACSTTQSPLVRGAAVWALSQLMERERFDGAGGERDGRRERCDGVRAEWRCHGGVSPPLISSRKFRHGRRGHEHCNDKSALLHQRPRRLHSDRRSRTARGTRNRCTAASSSACSRFVIEQRHGGDDFVPARLTVDMFRLPNFCADRGQDAADPRRPAHQGGRSRFFLRRRQHGARLLPVAAQDGKSARQGLVAAELGRAGAGGHSRADRSAARHERQMDHAPDRRRDGHASARAGCG